jgi:hypothetical protein
MQPGGAGPDVASPGRSFVRWFARHVGFGSERASLPAWLPAHARRRRYQVFDCADAEAWSCLPMLLRLQRATAGMRRGRHVNLGRGPLQHLRRLPRLRERWQHQVLSLPRLHRRWRKIRKVWLPTRGETGLGF